MKMNEKIMNLVGVILFYLVLILGVVAINARMESINNSENAISLEN